MPTELSLIILRIIPEFELAKSSRNRIRLWFVRTDADKVSISVPWTRTRVEFLFLPNLASDCKNTPVNLAKVVN